MKKIKIITSLFLILIIPFVVSCKNNSKKVTLPDGNYINVDESNVLVANTTHERNVSTSNNYFLQNGSTSYKFIISPQNESYVGKSIKEFNTFMKESTGIELTTETGEISYSDTAKYISLGNTAFLGTSGISVDLSDFKGQGYSLITKGNSIFVVAEDIGILYGIYDLLEILFGYEQITDKFYTLNKDVKNIYLPQLNIKEIPDYEYRIAPYGSLFNNSTARTRMKMVHDSEIFIDRCNTHSAFNIISYDDNKDEHPKWFASNGKQLCYTAHGDKNEFDAMINYAVESCKKYILADEKHNVLSFSQRDDNSWCSCSDDENVLENDTCSELNARYGTDAASQIIFVNKVAEKIEQWQKSSEDENLKNRNLMFCILAYHRTEKAPVIQNSDGSYSPIDDNVILRNNVEVMVAQLNADYVSGVNSSENIAFKNTFLSWKVLTKTFSVWSYDCYFGNYLVPYDSWSSMFDFVKFLKQMNTQVLFPQGAYNLKQVTNFDNLKTYLYSKMLWNVNIDFNATVNHYFDVMYKEASSIMKQAYFNMRVQLKQQESLGRDASIWTNTATTRYFSKRYLDGQLNLFEQAKNILEIYKNSDVNYYNEVIDNIVLEGIGCRYILLQAYSGTFSDENLKKFKEEFIKDVERLNVNRISEESSMAEYIKSLD